MLIERSKSDMTFDCLRRGDCFEFSGEIYIKTDFSNRSRNAFSLTCNTPGYFNTQDIVRVIKAKVVIE